MELIPGGVYKNRQGILMRIIQFDKIEVLYDGMAADGKWTFRNLKRKNFYFRMPTDVFLKQAEFVKIEKFSTQESETLRPDLPIRFLRYSDVSSFINTKITFDKVPESDQTLNGKINSSKLYLCCLTKNKRFSNSRLLESEESDGFPLREILEHAIQFKLEELGTFREMGFYRLGSQNHLPLYYIGEYLDAAGFVSVKN